MTPATEVIPFRLADVDEVISRRLFMPQTSRHYSTRGT